LSEEVGLPLGLQLLAVVHHGLVPTQVLSVAKPVWKNKNDMKIIIVVRM